MWHRPTTHAGKPKTGALGLTVLPTYAGGPEGDPGVCGAMTNGGSESILTAVKAARDWARRTRGVRHPEMVVGVSAHAAFVKAAEYFGVKLVRVRVSPEQQVGWLVCAACDLRLCNPTPLQTRRGVTCRCHPAFLRALTMVPAAHCKACRLVCAGAGGPRLPARSGGGAARPDAQHGAGGRQRALLPTRRHRRRGRHCTGALLCGTLDKPLILSCPFPSAGADWACL